jgi:hypothetical protein
MSRISRNGCFGPSLFGCVKYSLRSVERYVLKEFHTFLLSSNPSLARCLQVSLYLSSLCVADIQIKTPYALQRQNTEISKQIFPEYMYFHDWSAYCAGGNM